MKLNKFIVLLLVAALAVMTACSSTKVDNAAKGNNATNVKGEVYSLANDGVDPAAFATALSQFPADTTAKKIATTSVPLTEMLHMLGITPVGVPTSTNPMPADFAAIPRIGSSLKPDLEIVTKLEPDLLLSAESLRSTLEKSLEGIKMKGVYLRTESFEDLKLSFKVLGTYFNKKEEMNKILTTILNKENELIKQAEGKKMPTVMLMIGTTTSFMVMSEKSYLGSLVKKLGADNIATSVLKVTETYSPINMENVIAADPDIILVLASADHGATVDKFQKEVDGNTAWTKLSAYKNNKIHIMDYSTFGITSISNVDQALTQIANYFYK